VAIQHDDLRLTRFTRRLDSLSPQLSELVQSGDDLFLESSERLSWNDGPSTFGVVRYLPSSFVGVRERFGRQALKRRI